MRKYTLIMSFQILHKNGMQQLLNYSIFIHLPSHTIWWHWCIVYVLQLINKCNNMMKINTCIVQTKCNIAKSSPIYRIMNELSLLFYSLLSLHTHIKKPQTNISIVHKSQALYLLCTCVTCDLSFWDIHVIIHSLGASLVPWSSYAMLWITTSNYEFIISKFVIFIFYQQMLLKNRLYNYIRIIF